MTTAVDGPRRTPDFLVLLLNQNYEPLNVCPARRALVLLDKGKAELLENGVGYIYTSTRKLELPSVVRLMYFVRRPLPLRRLTRRELFQRDRFQCQYCGIKTRDLTLDHVLPRVRGGKHTWDNVVAACKACNHRKASHTPTEAGMALNTKPSPPSTSPYYPVLPYLDQRREWRKFVPANLLENW